MKKMIKDSVGLMTGIAVGGEAMKMAGNNMPSGFREATQIGIAAGITSKAFKKGKLL